MKEMEEETFEETVAYFADIYDKLNIVNLKLQGKEGNILDLRSTITGLGNKLKLWGNEISNGDFSISVTLTNLNLKKTNINRKNSKRTPI